MNNSIRLAGYLKTVGMTRISEEAIISTNPVELASIILLHNPFKDESIENYKDQKAILSFYLAQLSRISGSAYRVRRSQNCHTQVSYKKKSVENKESESSKTKYELVVCDIPVPPCEIVSAFHISLMHIDHGSSFFPGDETTVTFRNLVSAGTFGIFTEINSMLCAYGSRLAASKFESNPSHWCHKLKLGNIFLSSVSIYMLTHYMSIIFKSGSYAYNSIKPNISSYGKEQSWNFEHPSFMLSCLSSPADNQTLKRKNFYQKEVESLAISEMNREELLDLTNYTLYALLIEKPDFYCSGFPNFFNAFILPFLRREGELGQKQGLPFTIEADLMASLTGSLILNFYKLESNDPYILYERFRLYIDGVEEAGDENGGVATRGSTDAAFETQKNILSLSTLAKGDNILDKAKGKIMTILTLANLHFTPFNLDFPELLKVMSSAEFKALVKFATHKKNLENIRAISFIDVAFPNPALFPDTFLPEISILMNASDYPFKSIVEDFDKLNIDVTDDGNGSNPATNLLPTVVTTVKASPVTAKEKKDKKDKSKILPII